MLSCCTPPPPVNDSRDQLWVQFAHQSVDSILLSWGAPASETQLTDGSRLIKYQHSTSYDSQSPYERTSGCEVSFLAQAPHFLIDNIAMRGDPIECHQLAQGHTGTVRVPYIPPPMPVYPYPYRSYPF